MALRHTLAQALIRIHDWLEPKKPNKYGWKPQRPDHRDLKYGAVRPPSEAIATLPPKVDLREKLPPCWNQGQIGSCTAHGISAALVFDEQLEQKSFMMPSRLFIYYNERAMENSINSDNGAQIRSGIKSVASTGFADEATWPYVEKRFKVKPPQSAYDSAVKHKALAYMALNNTKLNELKSCLAAGFPFVFGFTVYDAFERDDVALSGVLSMPEPDESPQGGHCVTCVGYDDAEQTFLVRNSWGTDWGQAGHFTMPYAYMTHADLASDFWTLRKIS